MNRLCGLGGLALTLGVLAALAAALAAPVTPSRGRDEIDFAHLSNIALTQGQTYDQPLEVQQGGLSHVDFPYRFLAATPATIDVRISLANGGLLASQRLELPSTAPAFTPIPGLSASFWEGEESRIASVATPAPPAGQSMITVTLHRVDDGAEPVVLFIENPAASDGKPALAEMPGVALIFLTRYGAEEPVAAKLPAYQGRLAALNSAWPGAGFPLLAGLALVLMVSLIGGLVWLGGEEAGRKREQAEESLERS